MNIDIELSSFFIKIYNKDKLNFFFESSVPKIIFLSVYKKFIKEELFIPIELLLKEEKIKLVTECRKTGIKFNNKSLTEASKILYTINFINENS